MRKVIASIFALCCAIASCSTSGDEKPFVPHIEISTKSIDFDAEGGVKEIQIISNFDYVVLPNAKWLTAEKGENFMVKVKAESSNATESRSAKIYITSNHYGITETIVVSQGAYVPTFDTSGWAEMPSMPENADWEYCHHDKLPSNNKLRNYSFCFDKEKHCALWVAYPLHECYTEGRGKRTDAWSYDPCCVEDVYEPNLRNSYYSQGGRHKHPFARSSTSIGRPFGFERGQCHNVLLYEYDASVADSQWRRVGLTRGQYHQQVDMLRYALCGYGCTLCSRC